MCIDLIRPFCTFHLYLFILDPPPPFYIYFLYISLPHSIVRTSPCLHHPHQPCTRRHALRNHSVKFPLTSSPCHCICLLLSLFPLSPLLIGLIEYLSLLSTFVYNSSRLALARQAIIARFSPLFLCCMPLLPDWLMASRATAPPSV